MLILTFIKMKTNAPKSITLIIAVILAVLGVIGALITVPFLSVSSFWLLLVGFIVLLAGTLLKGL